MFVSRMSACRRIARAHDRRFEYRRWVTSFRPQETINVSYEVTPAFGGQSRAAESSLMRRFDELQFALQSCRWAQMSVRQQRVDGAPTARAV